MIYSGFDDLTILGSDPKALFLSTFDNISYIVVPHDTIFVYRRDSIHRIQGRNLIASFSSAFDPMKHLIQPLNRATFTGVTLPVRSVGFIGYTSVGCQTS